MKLTLPLIFVAFASAKVGAFQAKIAMPMVSGSPEVQVASASSLGNKNFHFITMHTVVRWGVPVTGCHCPFCAQMRALQS